MIRSGKICLSLLYNYILSPEIETEPGKYKSSDGNNELIEKNNKLHSISKVLESYGGVLSKLSQLVCIDDQNNTSFSDCKPFSQDKTTDYLIKKYNECKDREDSLFFNLTSVDFNVLKSGSVGQVHKAVFRNRLIGDDSEKDVIIKIQYENLVDQMKSDIQLLDIIVNFLYSLDLSSAVNNIKTKLFEELDYKKEVINQIHFKDMWKNSNDIIIPKIIPELCTEKIIGMEFIKGISFSDFVKTASYEDRNRIGELLVEFTFKNIYNNNIFYSDVHYGNFLIVSEPYENVKLCVLDFGCIHKIDIALGEKIKKLHKAILEDNEDGFYKIVESMGILKPDTGIESKTYMYKYFKMQYEPWTDKDFEFSDTNLERLCHKNIELMKEWNLPNDMVYFNKIPFGLFHLLTKLNLKKDFTAFFNNILY